MSKKLDIARALKDQAYFDGLTDEEKQIVQSSNPVGTADLSNDDLESVSGGLEGGELIATTTTTTNGTCSCSSSNFAPEGCACVC